MYKQVFKEHAQLLKMLANPKRLEIMQVLRHNFLRVGEMSRMLGLPQANLSQHLMVLRQFGVLEAERRGKKIYYRVTHKNFIKASDLIREILFERLGKKALVAAEQLVVVIDPVCGMRLTPASAARSLTKNGLIYYFCSAGCEREFNHKH